MVVMGDVNAHHGAWLALSTCACGDEFVSVIEASSLCILNSDTPTCLLSNGATNSPDLTLVLAHLAAALVWSTHIKLNLDNLPITVDFSDDTPSSRCARTFINFRLADWSRFLAEIVAGFTDLPYTISCASGERIFWDIVLKASGHSIPFGRRKEYTPGLPCEAVPLARCHDNLHHVDP
jgi:hypothetical protein